MIDRLIILFLNFGFSFIWSETVLMFIGFFGMTCMTQVIPNLRKHRKEYTNKAVGDKTKITIHVYSIFFALIITKLFKISFFEELNNVEFFIQISTLSVVAYMFIYLMAFISIINDDKLDNHKKKPVKHDAMEMHCIFLYLHDYQYNHIVRSAKKKGTSNSELIKGIVREHIKEEQKNTNK